MGDGASIVFREGDRAGEWALSGRLDLDAAVRLQPLLDSSAEHLHLDLRRVEAFTASGAAFLVQAIRRRGEAVSIEHASEALRQHLCELPVREVVEASPLEGSIEEEPFIVAAGGGWLDLVQGLQDCLKLGLEFVYWSLIAPLRGVPLRWRRTATEIHRAGVDAVPIVGLISFLIGVILSLNAASQLMKYGAEKFSADLVGISLARELSPVITAILIAGRSGSAVAAEISTMVVTEELDALRVMGINPRAYLIVPKLMALMISIPVLTMLSVLIGIGGGFTVALTVLNIPFEVYWRSTVLALDVPDILLGVTKGAVFGLGIGLIAATLGMRVRGGAAGVGRVTTTAVVAAFFFVLITNTMFTIVFYFAEL